MINQPNFNNFNGDVSILRGSCQSIEKDFDRKIQQTKNFLRQTTLSLQKIADSKQDLFVSSQSINPSDSPIRKISITKHQGIQLFDSERKLSKGLIDGNQMNDITSQQNIPQHSSNLLISAGVVAQAESNPKIYSAQNPSIVNDALSSKCSIQMDLKTQENSKEQENSSLMENQEFCIDLGNELEKRIHKWLDEQGIKMVNPYKKQDYYDQKRSQILIMHKKKHYTQSTFITQNLIASEEPKFQTTQISEKFISYSHNISPQKMYKIESYPQSEYHQLQKGNLRTPHLVSSGSDIIITTLFSSSITDSPLMQRRKIMIQNAQESQSSNFTTEKKCSNLSINPANNQMKSSLAHLSQYKRSSQSKSNNDIVSSDIPADCK